MSIIFKSWFEADESYVGKVSFLHLGSLDMITPFQSTPVKQLYSVSSKHESLDEQNFTGGTMFTKY